MYALKVYIVDDDTSFVVLLEAMLEEIPGFDLIGKSSNFDQAINDIKDLKPDIVISDVRLNNEHTGMEVAADSDLEDTHFVFVTAFSDQNAYSKSREYSSKFIVKPFDVLTLQGLLEEIRDDVVQLSGSHKIQKDTLFIRKNNVLEKVRITDFDYLYSEGNYITFFVDDKRFVIKYSLTKLLENPKFHQFVRIHRSYAIHRDKLDKVNFSDKELTIKGTVIPFGRTYTKNVRAIMDTVQ